MIWSMCFAIWLLPVLACVRCEHFVLPLLGPHVQPSIVVMPVALDMFDAEQRHHRQILKQRHRAEVAQILAGQQNLATLSPMLCEQACIGDSFHDAFAILVARACVTKCERPWQITHSAIRLVDN